jgi:hypothetical protein
MGADQPHPSVTGPGASLRAEEHAEPCRIRERHASHVDDDPASRAGDGAQGIT